MVVMCMSIDPTAICSKTCFLAHNLLYTKGKLNVANQEGIVKNKIIFLQI